MGQEGRDLAQLPPFPETDWFTLPTSEFSPPLPPSQGKIFSLSTEGGGGQMCWGNKVGGQELSSRTLLLGLCLCRLSVSVSPQPPRSLQTWRERLGSLA